MNLALHLHKSIQNLVDYVIQMELTGLLQLEMNLVDIWRQLLKRMAALSVVFQMQLVRALLYIAN